MKSVPAPLVFLALSAILGCRDPEADQETFPPHITDFDASLPDGGEPAPEAACTTANSREFNNNFSPFFGGETAVDAEVVHFSSFYCSHCAELAAYTTVRWANRREYAERVRVYFHHATFSFRHRAAVAAQNQGDAYFWEIHDFIYSEMLAGRSPSESAIVSFAESLGLDMARFNEDLDADETYAFLKWDANQGLAAGMVGTPTVFVCGDKLSYWPDLEEAIDGHL